ncbi:MAG: polyphosphate kinase 1 [Deltaproteobacteria bacterium]|nr:polyphosphate kinase 1 [Deltaproteobacteria bacterium]MBW2530126.1 polyphosphate kinase 1 [Deltaproteobacteria bacterium]
MSQETPPSGPPARSQPPRPGADLPPGSDASPPGQTVPTEELEIRPPGPDVGGELLVDDASESDPGLEVPSIETTPRSGRVSPTSDAGPPSKSTAGRAALRDDAEAPQGAARYFNRELSWLRFNERVLEEALDESNPLLERVKFLSIFGNNLDEFFMVRVSGLRRQLRAGVVEAPPDGMSPTEQLAAVREQLLPTLSAAHGCWSSDLRTKLEDEGIRVLSYDDLKKKQRKLMRRHFKTEIFPVLTPMASDPGHPFPHISNLSINLAIVARHPKFGERFARLKVPQTFPRLLRIPEEEKADRFERLGLAEIVSPTFVWLEEVIAANLDMLFPGVDILAVHPFRVTRDADLEIEEDEASDLLLAMSEVVEQRFFGTAVRLEVDEAMPKRIRNVLTQNLRLERYQVYRTPSPMGLSALSQLSSVDRPALKYPVFFPVSPPSLTTEETIFDALRNRNMLLYHPYDSFNPVVSFLREAATDPDVLAIKQTLYRTGPRSPVVEALMHARENGKQVSVLVEIKARFDEENNIVWARALERAGVHVTYGVMGLKTHAKACLVVRREHKGIRRYVHLATGNYNPITARVYTDLGYFTCQEDIADDVSDLFNALTGISAKNEYRKLLVAPGRMRQGLLERIDREIEAHRKTGEGRLVFKLNALADKPCINALYQASQEGVNVDLQVRGVCCLKPGIPGLSDNITVTSIVGQFLEHTRIYYFHNGGDEEILLGSADIMFRNLSRRVETLFPVEDDQLKAAIRDSILFVHLRDTVKSRQLSSDGEYQRVLPADGSLPLNSQKRLLDTGGAWRQMW